MEKKDEVRDKNSFQEHPDNLNSATWSIHSVRSKMGSRTHSILMSSYFFQSFLAQNIKFISLEFILILMQQKTKKHIFKKLKEKSDEGSV